MSQVVAVSEENEFDAIQLDDTMFHPRGGGQPGDQGFLIKDDQKFRVHDTIKRDGIILHLVEKDHDLEQGEEISLELDYKRRKILTRMHTAEHILFKSLENHVRNIKLNKISLDPKESGILVSAPDLDFNQVLVAEKLANQVVREDRKISEHKVPKNEVKERFPGIRIKEDRIEEETVRVLKIKDFDLSACTGTHLESTAEVGKILVTRILSEGKSFWEIKFKIDVDEELFQLADVARRTQGLMGTNYDTMVDAIKNLKQENEDLKSQLNKLSKGIKVEVKKEQIGPLSLLYAVFPGITKKQFVKKINGIEEPKTIAVFINETRGKCHVAIRVCRDCPQDAKEILEELTKHIPGKGGGNKELAQGNFAIEDAEEIIQKLKKVLA